MQLQLIVVSVILVVEVLMTLILLLPNIAIITRAKMAFISLLKMSKVRKAAMVFTLRTCMWMTVIVSDSAFFFFFFFFF